MANYDSIIQAAAQRFNVDPNLLRGVIATESSGNPSARSGVGATGLMQIMPANYKALGITDPTDPQQNIMGGAQLLSQLLDRYGDPVTALRHYQGGDDTSQWGPINAAYPGKVLKAAGIAMPSQQGNPMPTQKQSVVDRMLGGSQQTTSAQQIDPFAGISGGSSSSASPGQYDPFAGLNQPTASQATPQQPPAPAEQPGSVMSFLAGIGRGVQQTALGAQQLVGHGAQAIGLNGVGNWLVNDANQGLQAGAQQVAPYSAAHPILTKAGEIGGSIAATAPLGAIGPEVVGVGSAIGRGALSGGLTTLASPVDPNSQNYWTDKAKQLATAGATGAVLGPAAYGVGRLISPQVSPEVQMLLDRGIITPTPGQIAGGIAARTEAKLTSAPGIGDAIVAGQRRAMDQFNRATYQDALEQVGQNLPRNVATGSEGVNYVRNQLGQQYDSIANRASFVADQNFGNDLTTIRNTLAQEAPGALNQFDNIVNNQITAKLQNGALTGPQWNDSRSMIANISRRQITGNANADNWALHDALDDLTTALNNGVGRSSAPDVIADLQRANAGWARYKQIEKAAGMAGASNNGNIFTPAQYTSSIRAGSTAAQKGTNSGLNADFANAAQNVLGAKYPDSGTAGRGLMNLLGSGIVTGGLITNPMATLGGLGGVALGSIPYTALGQRGIAALMTARPQFTQPIGNAVSRLGPAVVAGSLPALLSGSR